ncbi:MAG: hypothetical protein NZ895_05300 [Archaeoglobaceae archaeon]|nr:hypothetical protein [Archaeoglobaceae archaeon]MCX8151513.1 hypothetical protein [Archaeoglobaceae archaeon]MDW8013251.1 hypothetical protein [Archaeoglobaceae archaeon]
MKLAFGLIALLFLIQISSAQVLEISEMKLSVFVKDKAHMRYEMTLKNKIDKPLVPGISEIRLQKVEPTTILIFPIPFGERKQSVEVENLKAYSENINLKTSFEKFDEYSAIYYELWYPIEPYGERRVVLEFDADLVDHGILFKSITIPIGGDVDIKKVELNLTSDWKLCYFEKEIKTVPANHITFVTAEFSIIPFPILPFRGYLLFWGTVLSLVLVLSLIAKKLKRAEKS